LSGEDAGAAIDKLVIGGRGPAGIGITESTGFAVGAGRELLEASASSGTTSAETGGTLTCKGSIVDEPNPGAGSERSSLCSRSRWH